MRVTNTRSARAAFVLGGAMLCWPLVHEGGVENLRTWLNVALIATAVLLACVAVQNPAK